MADFSSLSLKFDDVGDGCTLIFNYITSLEYELNSVKQAFTTMTQSWEGMARAAFEEDFNVMDNSMTTTLTTMREVTDMIKRYNEGHREVESGFGSGGHVTLG